MACPFFMPLRRMEPNLSTNAPRLPLGGAYHGVCHAQPGAVFEPPHDIQRECCNRGYARGQCGRFPSADGADAVRFSIRSEDHGTVKVIYILEKDHAPAEHGTIEFTGGKLTGSVTNLLAAQAQAFVQSYLRRLTTNR